MTGQPGDQNATRLLESACAGDHQAAAKLLPLVYDELRQLARARMAGVPPGNTLNPTALVHEAYLRLLGYSGADKDPAGMAAALDPGWKGRAHFFGAAAKAMRDILIEQARRKAAVKHGAKHGRAVGADAEDIPHPGFELCEPPEDVLLLQAAVQRLEARDPRKAEIVSLRYFAGLTQAETAAVLQVSDRTIEREWRYIKAWLSREMEQVEQPPGDQG